MDIEKLRKKIFNRVPLLGNAIRRRAVKSIGVPESTELVSLLISCLDSEDKITAELAVNSLLHIKKQQIINAACEAWAISRDNRLGNILKEGSYIASEPVDVRVLSALKIGKIELIQDAKAVPFLIMYLNDGDKDVASNAEKSLRDLTNVHAINALCSAWAISRDIRLGNILKEGSYIASEPVDVRVLSALKIGKFELIQNAKAIPFLIKYLNDRDKEISISAGRFLHKVNSTDGINLICDEFIRTQNATLGRIIVEKDFQHSVVSRRCLVYILNRRFNKYLDLDYEFQNLKPEYRAADDTLKERIRNIIRESGDSRLLGLFKIERKQKLASELTPHEASLLLDVHQRNKQWNEIFTLMFYISPDILVKALRILKTSGWKPDDSQKQNILNELYHYEQQVSADLFKPLDLKYALGDVFYSWLENGKSKEFSGKTEADLMKMLNNGAPPEAVSALAALCSRRALTESEITSFEKHKHWMVRLAVLALLPQNPVLFFDEYNPKLSGGEIWIKTLSENLLSGAVYSLRAVSFSPESLINLQAKIPALAKKNSVKLPVAKAMETLCKYNLRHAIEIDLKKTVAIDETAIEIEG